MIKTLYLTMIFIALSELACLSQEITVQKGDTLLKIAEENNISLRELMDMNKIYNINELKAGQRIKIPDNLKILDLNSSEMISYRVRKGDTLTSIANLYDTTHEKLSKMNNINNLNDLKIGQIINVPARDISQNTESHLTANKRNYIVQKGDTLSKISESSNVSIKGIMKLNKLASPNNINVGQVIILPAIKNESQITKDDLWKTYGPLNINWSNLEYSDGSYIGKTIHKNGKPLYLAINCKSRKINSTKANGEWKDWFSPNEEFEHKLINDICKDILN